MSAIERYGVPRDQFNEQFVDRMRRAMAMSFHKYGHMLEAAQHGVDLAQCLQDRVALYLETRNTEHLVDVANYAMMEFTTPTLEGAYYEPKDSDASPGAAMKPKRNVTGQLVAQRHIHGPHRELGHEG